MKRMLAMILALACALSLTACGGRKQDPAAPEQNAEAGSEIEITPDCVTDNDIGENPSDTNDDDIGENPSDSYDDGIDEKPSGIHDDGIGQVVPLTPDEERYMLAQTTNSWLEMGKMEKDDLVVLVGRTLEAAHGFIVADYDELVVMLDRRMEQYYRDGVDESVLKTVCDICGIG